MRPRPEHSEERNLLRGTNAFFPKVCEDKSQQLENREEVDPSVAYLTVRFYKNVQSLPAYYICSIFLQRVPRKNKAVIEWENMPIL